jgi:hypothetical protein
VTSEQKFHIRYRREAVLTIDVVWRKIELDLGSSLVELDEILQKVPYFHHVLVVRGGGSFGKRRRRGCIAAMHSMHGPTC